MPTELVPDSHTIDLSVRDEGPQDEGPQDEGLSDQMIMQNEDMLSTMTDMLIEADVALSDEDEDGYPIGQDCDDSNPLIFPGAEERCNQVDDDCDLRTDEGEELADSPTWYQDTDEDRYGTTEDILVSCVQPAGYVEIDGDCDDENPQINPMQAELCDGIDNNCSMIIDEGVISDGQGCQDPGHPEWPINIQYVHLTIRNGNNAGGDGSLELSLFDGTNRVTRSLNNVSWDDHMRHTVDVYEINLQENGLTHERLSGQQAVIDYDSSNAWALSCTQLNIDGVVVACDHYSTSVELDAGSQETLNLNLPTPLPTTSLPCTCYDTYLSHGPIIGTVGPNNARIWGRSDATRKVTIKLGLEPSALSVVTYRYPKPEKDYTFEVDILGLEPSTQYYYAIEIEEQITTGQFRTAPQVGQSGTYEFAVGSCAKTIPSRHPEQPVFNAINNAQPDMLLLLGDNVYFDSLSNGDAPDVGAMRSYYRDAIQRRTSWSVPFYPPNNVYDPGNPLIRPSSLDRARWWGVFGRDSRADAFASIPTLAIWDDHDFYSNNADAFYDDNRGRKPWTFDSLNIFNDYWPNPDGGLSENDPNRMGIYFKQTWGDVDIFGLDTRFHRDDSREKMLGRAQMDWIKAELSASQATFKFVLSGSIFAGPTNDDEKWPHFEADRAELFNHIWDQNIGGVVLMSGDIHISSILAHRNPNSANNSYPLYEVISSGLANYGPSNPSSDDYGSLIQMRYMPPFVYHRARTTVFAKVAVDTTLDDPLLSVDFIDEDGNSACADCPFELRRSQLGL